MQHSSTLYMLTQWARYEGYLNSAISTMDSLSDQIWQDRSDFGVDFVDGMLEECEEDKDKILQAFNQAYLKVVALNIDLKVLKTEITQWSED